MMSPACQSIHSAILRAVRELGPQLPPAAAVLDAPCGDGELSQALATLHFEVSGADITSGPAPAGLRDRYRICDLNQPLPYADGAFALIVCAEGIEHLENPFAFAREAHRILHPGGFLIVSTPNVLGLRSRVRYLASGFYTQDPRPLHESARHPLHHIGLRTFWEWRYLLHTTGFRLTRVSHTHIKPISYLYAGLAPYAWLYTRIAFRRERDPVQRRHNHEIFRVLTSRSLLLGENLLLVAQRLPE